MTRTLLLTVGLLALAACSSESIVTASQSLPDPETVDFAHQASDLVMDEEITYGVLPNGLRYAVMENSTPTRTATLLMRIDAGSLDETDATRGLAHFLEHMAFNGSENIPEGEMTKRLERLGLSFGADTNASTSFEETIYQLELPEVSDDLLTEALSIFRETAERLTLDPDAIDRERGVILAERRARNSPNYRAAIAGLEFQTEATGLVDRLPIGVPETIESVTPDDFRAFYDTQYRPEDTFIVLVGDRPREQMAQMIEAAFADWQATGEGAPDAEVAGFNISEPRYGAFFDPEITTRLTLSTLTPAYPEERTRDTAANRAAELPLFFANRILNRRYAKLIRSGGADFTGAGVGASDVFGAARTAQLTVNAETDTLEPAFIQAERELRRALDHGFSQAELDEQIANVRKDYEIRVQTSPTRRTPTLARAILSAFSNERVMTSAASSLERFDAIIESVTLEDVETAFREAWSALDTAPQLYMQSDEVVEDPEAFLADLLARSRGESLPAQADTDAGEFAYADWGEPSEVVERGKIEDFDLTTVRFANNVRLTMKKTPYEKDVIRTRIRTGSGSAFYPLEDAAFGTQLSSILGRSALAAHDADQLATLTAGKAVGVSRGFGQEVMTLSGATVPSDIDLHMQLFAAHLTDPGFRPEVIDTFQKQVRAVWSKFDSTPGGAASIGIPPILTGNHPTSRHPDEAEVTDVDLDALRAWYDANAKDGPIEIAVVGDIDEDAIIDAVARTFGALPERGLSAPAIPDAALDYDFPEGRQRPFVLTHQGEPDTAMVRVYWPVPNHDDAVTDREIGMLASVLKLELTERLREQEGATYSPNTFTSLPRLKPDYGYVAVSIEAAPDEVDRLTSIIEQTATELATEGVEADLFDRAVTPVIENIETSLENNSYWLGLADDAQSDPDSLDRYRTREATYQNMTPDDVASQATAVFAPDRAIRIHILPEG